MLSSRIIVSICVSGIGYSGPDHALIHTRFHISITDALNRPTLDGPRLLDASRDGHTALVGLLRCQGQDGDGQNLVVPSSVQQRLAYRESLCQLLLHARHVVRSWQGKAR